MFLVYKLEGQEPQTHEFKPGRVKLSEQARIERDYARLVGERKTFQGIMQELREGGATAIRLALHMCLRRDHATVRLDDVDPMGDEVEVKYHVAELKELRANIDAAKELPGREALLRDLDWEISRAPDADPDEEPGKATGSTSSTRTGSSAAGRSPKRGRRTP